MTSSLPNLSPSSLAPVASDFTTLVGLVPVGDPSPAVESGNPAEFAAVLSATPGVTPPVKIRSSVPVPPGSVISEVVKSARIEGGPLLTPTSLADIARALTPAGTRSGKLTELPPGFAAEEALLPVLAEDGAIDSIALSEKSIPAIKTRNITREMQEEAVAFAATLMQALLPGIQLPKLTFEGASPVVPSTEGSESSQAGALFAVNIPVNQALPPATFDRPQLTMARDGVYEFCLNLAPPESGQSEGGLAGARPVKSQLDETSFAPAGMLKIQAELAIEGQPIARLEATALFAPGAVDAVQSKKEIFAGNNHGHKNQMESSEQSAERNFVFTGDKLVKTSSPVAGITVAKLESTMPVAPIEDVSPVRTPELFSGLPQQADFQVVVPPAERITVPAATPAGQNFSERAVETVTSLVENQFSASLQKSGSVQLRLLFGGEDLRVRVQILDGNVHTEFSTDSPELRSALAHGWQAVAGQSHETMVRYLDPVFSPHSSFGGDTNPAARSHQQFSQEHPSRPSREAWAESANHFSRRSHLNDSFIPEPAVVRRPAFLPTSLRLSALA